ncbi:MAG TPA: T9SS type A sorting domain-containing protein [Chitinophagales bacterium]|nr:T9SS type A sorting domain-containing protein [Chitinophagales bacterium]HRK28359.1 T9SS type A sorting domain-containing protein [Chitinophagales bacterium]
MKKLYSYILFASLTVLVALSGNASAQSLYGGGDGKQISSSLSPNPAKDKTTLKFQYNNRDAFRLEIYDVIGNKVRVVENIAGSSVEIDISDLEVGMYFYFLVKGSERVSTGRLIVKQ